MASDVEVAAMRHALALAAAADVRPNPNPRVGCVLLDGEGRELAAAAHGGAGTPHAEAAALAAAGSLPPGCTAVVTLEPCHGHDRPGRCTQALLAAGVRRVVFAQTDPNPAVAGGAAELAAHGVDVEGGVLADEAELLNAFWSASLRLGRPVVTWKVATTIDGRVAAADGTSRWITGPEARRDVHARRAECDAVLVGTGTALADDPQLTVRDVDDRPLPRERQPLRVVLGHRPLPEQARLRDGSARTVQLETHDPRAALDALFEQKIRHVWLEGGPTVAAAFLRAGLVDEVIAYVAPAILGEGPAAVADFGVETLGAAPRLRLVDAAVLGDDVRITWTREA